MQEALNLAFPCSMFSSNVVLCTRNKKGDWKEGFAVVPVNKLASYVEELKINKNLDYYITANTIKNEKKAKRETGKQFSFRNIVIDIDIHNENISEWDKMQELIALSYYLTNKKEIPQPNIINWTGRGLQAWYCLEEISVNFKMQWLAVSSELVSRIEKIILNNSKELANCDVDRTASKNMIGVYRLFNTYNTKTHTQAEAEIIHSNRYKLQELYNALITYEPKKKKAKAELQEIITDYLPLHKKRKRFIEWLVEDRKEIKGQRDIVLFQYVNACYSFLSKEQAQAETNALNSCFKEPLPERELQKIYKYFDTHGTLDRMTVEGFLEFLNCSSEEIKHYKKMRTVKQNYTRDNERRLNEMEKQDRNKKIVKMRKDGLSINDIINKTGLSKRQIIYILSESGTTAETLKQERDKKVLELKNKGLTVAEITKLTDISKETYYRIIRQSRELETV